MKRYIIRRILSGILTVLVVFALSFIIIKAAPGDPIKTLMGKDNNDPELRAALEEKWGLNEPEYQQFFSYLDNALHGDLGTSIIFNRPVSEMIGEKVGPTLLLGITVAFLITGVTLIEIVFAWPGMGRLTMTAITQRDYPTLLGIYLIIALSVSVVMILVDVVYALFDPRIRYE